MGQCNSLNHKIKYKETIPSIIEDNLSSRSSTSTSSSNQTNYFNGSPIKQSKTTKSLKYKGGSYSQDIREVYKLQDLISSGKFGNVHIGYKRGELPRRLYAIKSITKKSLLPKALNDLLNEVEITSQLKHPNIVKLYETYYDDTSFHIVMELCDGKDLIDFMGQNNGAINEDIVVKIIMKVLHAVSYCHSKGIVHRDLKPENILFNSQGEGDIKLIDFGLGKKYDLSTDDLMSSILGTPYYIAPEILKGEYNHKCDVWGIGIITYLMLSGELPFYSQSTTELYNKILTDDIEFPNEKWSHISHAAKDFIQLCLVKPMDNRWNAFEALEHCWFKTVFQSVHSDHFIHQKPLINIRAFTSYERLKMIVLNWIVNNTFQQDYINMLKDFFYAIDAGHSGHITMNELQGAFNKAKIEICKEEIEMIIMRLGNDDNEEQTMIDYASFIIACSDKEKLIEIKGIEKAFEYFDIDRNGYIDVNDLRKAILKGGNLIINNDEEIKFMIDEVVNDKMRISKKDFIQMLTE